MGTLSVDQIDIGGRLVRDVDTTLTERDKDAILIRHLPGATTERCAGVRVVRFRDQVILKKQVTHLGYPWPEFKKRIQIPRSWVDAHEAATRAGLVPRFVGIYQYRDVTILVDFAPSTYVRRKANNSAAHVATNDLHQAQLRGVFSRTDRNGNRITSVRADRFAAYLLSDEVSFDPHLEVFRAFNQCFLDGRRLKALDAVKEMHTARWPDTFQAEWPGFYLEYRFQSFLDREKLTGTVNYLKDKRRGGYDYDLAFLRSGVISHYGDLKASDYVKHESPGNDAASIERCVREFGQFWYVIYEHETTRARDNENVATIAWNEWKRSVGYKNGKDYNPMSYWTRFKESVRFVSMIVLEVNEANFEMVLGDFAQGQQPDGAKRALKVMIRKRNIDNFLIYRERAPELPVASTG